MSLYDAWGKMAYEPKDQKEYEIFWNEYLPKETKIYEYLLENRGELVKGSVHELATQFEVDDATFVGFLDGINTSLKEPLNMEELAEESSIALNMDLEKLYFNMLGAKADWLYNLPVWEKIFSEEERKNIRKEYNKSKQATSEKMVGRNDPCPCGSGEKYKKCCGKNQK